MNEVTIQDLHTIQDTEGEISQRIKNLKKPSASEKPKSNAKYPKKSRPKFELKCGWLFGILLGLLPLYALGWSEIYQYKHGGFHDMNWGEIIPSFLFFPFIICILYLIIEVIVFRIRNHKEIKSWKNYYKPIYKEEHSAYKKASKEYKIAKKEYLKNNKKYQHDLKVYEKSVEKIKKDVWDNCNKNISNVGKKWLKLVKDKYPNACYSIVNNCIILIENGTAKSFHEAFSLVEQQIEKNRLEIVAQLNKVAEEYRKKYESEKNTTSYQERDVDRSTSSTSSIYTSNTEETDDDDDVEYMFNDEMSELIDVGEDFKFSYVEEGPATMYPAIAKFEYKEFHCEFDWANKRIRTPTGIEYEYIYLSPQEFKVGKRVNKLFKK